MEAEGETITVNDSADNALLGLKIYGKTTQVSTTGANLAWANINIANQPYLGVVCSETEDGNVILCGTATGNMWNRLASAELVGGQTYTLSSHKAVSLSVWDVTANGSFTVKPSSQDSIVFVAPNTGSYSLCIENATGALFECIRADIMLNIGETALPWEPYSGGVASPSPDWSQEIVNLENPTMRILGKNVWNHEYDTVDMSNVQGWGNPIWLNDAVVDTLLPDTVYTLKFDVTCLSVPAYESLFSDDCGFVLYSSKPGATVMVMAEDTGNGAFHVGEKRTVTGTFKTPSNLHEPTIGYEIFRYTQRYLKSDGNAVLATVKFENVQLEIGDRATEYVACDPTQTLSFTRSLPGIPVSSGGNYTDSDGQQWICDEIDFERGVYVKRVGLSSMESDPYIEYIYSEKMGSAQLIVAPDPLKNQSVYGTLCNVAMRNDDALNSVDGEYYENPANIVFVGSASDDETSIRQKYSAFELLYALETPIETPLTDAELASFKMVRTNYPSTTVLNDSGAHMAIKYAADTKTYVDNHSLSNGTLVDTATGKLYRLVVTNGQLTVVAV